MADLTFAEFRAMWRRMTEEERDRVRAKARWERMSLWAVLEEWPSLRPAAETTPCACDCHAPKEVDRGS